MDRPETHGARRLASLAVLAAVFAFSASAPGIENFHTVNDHVYRGAQPTRAGFHSLARLGVRTVIDLRRPEERSNRERQLVQAQGMRYVWLPMDSHRVPPDGEMAKALAILNNPSAAPVFVHCREGKDRTGAVIASYRIAHDGWTNRRALAEAKSYGMHNDKHKLREYILHFHSPAAAQ